MSIFFSYGVDDLSDFDCFIEIVLFDTFSLHGWLGMKQKLSVFLAVEFLQYVLLTLRKENWSSAPLVFITQGLSCITPDAVLDHTTLAYIRSVQGVLSLGTRSAGNVRYEGVLKERALCHKKNVWKDTLSFALEILIDMKKSLFLLLLLLWILLSLWLISLPLWFFF